MNDFTKPVKLLKDCKILVTPTSFSRYDKNLALNLEKAVGKVIYNTTGKPLNERDLSPLVLDIDGYIAGLDEITENVIQNAPNLKIISRYGTGTDNVDLKAAKNAGIYVTNTPGANSVSVAELTIGFAIAAARNIPEGNIKTKNGEWPRLSGSTLHEKTFGLIGLGNIGKEVAKRLYAFGATILAYDINIDMDFAEKYNIEYCDIEKILSSSDFVSLHIPIFKDTINIINTSSLAKMKKGTILINTARGELIDEDALYSSIASGHIRAAALDTFKLEPPGSSNKLISLPQVIATPHIGAATDNASNEMTRISIEECLLVLKGEKPRYLVIGK
jgi:D-3-phosphoglycerate dehydrogenase